MKLIRTRRWALIGLVPLMMACGKGHRVMEVPLTDQRFAPRPEGHRIEVYRGVPQRAHIEIAKLDIDNNSFGFDKVTSPAEVIEKMRQRTRELGGDALKEVRTGVGAAGTTGQGTAYGSAVAIRWR